MKLMQRAIPANESGVGVGFEFFALGDSQTR